MDVMEKTTKMQEKHYKEHMSIYLKMQEYIRNLFYIETDSNFKTLLEEIFTDKTGQSILIKTRFGLFIYYTISIAAICTDCKKIKQDNPFFTKEYKLRKNNLKSLVETWHREVKKKASGLGQEPIPFNPSLCVWVSQYVIEKSAYDITKLDTLFLADLMEAQLAFHMSALSNIKKIVSLDPSLKSRIQSTVQSWVSALASGEQIQATTNVGTALYYFTASADTLRSLYGWLTAT